MTLENTSSFHGIGRRKTSTARLFLIPQSEKTSQSLLEVNGKKGEEYFQYNFNFLNEIHKPLQSLDLMEDYRILAKVQGGGLTGQAKALQLALARALCQINPSSFRPILKKEAYLSRDARIKERRKYGLKKARKASQYSKR